MKTIQTVEERLISLEDEWAIRNLAARFADATTIGDHESFKKLWKADAVFTISEPNYSSKTGVEEISNHIRNLGNDLDYFVQFVHSGVIEVTGNNATARWIIHEEAQGGSEKFYRNYAIANDTMEKIDGQWVYSTRRFDYIWIDFSKVPGKPVKLPAYK